MAARFGIGIDIAGLHRIGAAGLSGLERLQRTGRQRLVFGADIDRVDISEAGERTERHRVPVGAADGGRPNLNLLDVIQDLLSGLRPNRTARRHVASIRPGPFRVFVRGEQFPVAVVEHVEESAAGGLHHRLALLTAEILADPARFQAIRRVGGGMAVHR
jgi:hypothetical protein